MKRLAACAAVLAQFALSSCATGVKSTLPATAAAPDYVGASPVVVSAESREADMARVQAALEALTQRDWGIPLQVGRTPEGLVRVRLGADESFEARTAQLQPAALLLYSEIAKVLQTAPESVTHVLVYGADAAGNGATGLCARRAASVQSYLVTRNLPATRLRAEGRDAREPVNTEVSSAANRRVELVIRPVVAGREAEAWMPPATAALP